MHNNLHKYVYISLTYVPNLVYMHIDIHMNCKPFKDDDINSMNMFLY